MRVSDESDRSDLDISRIMRALAAKRWLILGPTLLAFVVSLVAVNLIKSRYAADARVLLENQENFLPHAEKNEVKSEAPLLDAEAVQSQIQLITSRDLARRVIRTLELKGDEEFDPLAKGLGLWNRALIMFGLMRDPTKVSPEDRMLDSFADRLAVISPSKTRVISIEFSSQNPDLAARGANTIADVYLDFQREAKRENARNAAKSLAALVADLRARVGEAEAQAEDFRTKSGLLIGSNNTTITAQHLSDLNTQLSLSRSTQADAQAKANLLREMLQQHRLGDIPDVANNEVMRRLIEQRVTLRSQLALESRTLLPGHPRIKELQAQLDNLEQQTRVVADRVVRTLENDARIAGARVDNLSRALDAQKKVVGATEVDDVKLRELERTARLYKEQLEIATAKYQQALSREDAEANPADARIVQRALAPQLPTYPKKIPIVGFATFAALALSVGALLAREMLTSPREAASVRPRPAARPVDVGENSDPAPERDADSFGRAELGSRPAAAADLEPLAVAAFDAGEEAEEAPFGQALAHDEVHALDEPHGRKPESTVVVVDGVDAARLSAPSVKVLMACGGSSPEAVSTVLALARALAQRGRAVLVATDASETAYEDLVPHGAERPKGLRDLLTGAADFGEVIQREPGSRLHVIAPGVDDEAPRFDVSVIVEALARTYDFVVFATSAAMNALTLAPLFDKILLRAADASTDDLLRALSDACDDVSVIQDAGVEPAAV